MKYPIRQVGADERDEELAEEWTRVIKDRRAEAIRGVGASKWAAKQKWPWTVTVWVMEYVRDEPLEGELRERIESALRATPGVKAVAHEDREVWIVSGTPTGEALVASVAAVVDSLAARARAYPKRRKG